MSEDEIKAILIAMKEGQERLFDQISDITRKWEVDHDKLLRLDMRMESGGLDWKKVAAVVAIAVGGGASGGSILEAVKAIFAGG